MHFKHFLRCDTNCLAIVTSSIKVITIGTRSPMFEEVTVYSIRITAIVIR